MGIACMSKENLNGLGNASTVHDSDFSLLRSFRTGEEGSNCEGQGKVAKRMQHRVRRRGNVGSGGSSIHHCAACLAIPSPFRRFFSHYRPVSNRYPSKGADSGRRRPVARGARVLAARRVDGLDSGGLRPVLHRPHFLAGTPGPAKDADYLLQSNS